MTSQRTSFPGSGGAQLAGRLELPVGPPRAAAVFVHCFTCGKDSVGAARVSRALAQRGIAVLRFDFTGLGGSGGDFASTGFSSNVEDLVLAAQHLAATVAPATLLVGHSLGGAAVLAAAAELPDVAAVATIGAPADATQVVGLPGAAADTAARDGVAEVVLGGRRFTVSASLLADLALANCRSAAAALRRPLLLLHSPTDEVVGVENARTIFDAARHPVSFVALDGADHVLSRRVDAEYAADVIATWAARYVPVPSDGPEPPEGAVVVSGTAADGMRHAVAAGRHGLVLDEPVPTGTDTGPTPYDAMLGALGACTAMTVRLYAQRKGWSLEDVDVNLRHDRIHARDCDACETTEGRLDRIRREVRLDGPLDDAQRARLLEVADKCPVHRTMTAELVIETREG
jgi:uncharacterized OsmC-like protein/pimeloyl-ACP methyl ester carboxylesterase